MQNFILPEPVLFVINRLRSFGYPAYAVGGCVRDHCMGRIPHDYDVTTSAKPDEMIITFSDCRVVETGLKHGTITVVIDKMNVEITTYRIDGTYSDCRRPESVVFTTDLSEDLRRRDFTINAMAYSPKKNSDAQKSYLDYSERPLLLTQNEYLCNRCGIIDLFGGINDLERKVIKCVGSAEERFSEDALRILRAIRFASTLNFTLDEECAEAARTLKQKLDKISRERIYAELTKLLCGVGAPRIIMQFPEIIAQVLPPLTSECVIEAGRLFSDLSKEFQTCSRTPDIDKFCHENFNCDIFDQSIFYAVLLSVNDISSEIAAQIMSSLKPSKAEKSAVMNLIKHKNFNFQFSNNDFGQKTYLITSLISKTSDVFPLKLATYKLALKQISNLEFLEIFDIIDEIIKNNAVRKLSDLAINGQNLLSIGFSGSRVGSILSILLDKVMRHEIPNDSTAILNFAKTLL